MRQNKVSYEWLVEQIDAETEDVIDVNHYETAKEALKDYKIGLENEELLRIGLVCDVYNDYEGVVDRMWAYADNNLNLSIGFEDSFGVKIKNVSKKHLKEWNEAIGVKG